MKHLGKRVLAMILALGITTSMLVSDVSAMQVYAAGSTEYVDEETTVELLSEEGGEAVSEESSVEEVAESVEDSSEADGDEPSGEIEDVEESEEASVEETTEAASSIEETTEGVTTETEAASTEEITTEELTIEEVTTEEVTTEELTTEETTEEMTTEMSTELTDAQGVAAVAASNKVNDGFTLSADGEGKLVVEFTEEGMDEIAGNVLIPAAVKIIPADSKLFKNNTSVTKVTFEDDSELEKIEEQAFFGSSITSIELPASLTTIETQAFHSSQLERITFEAGGNAVIVGESAFAENDDLKTVTTNGRLGIIGESAFSNDKSLDKTINLTGVTAIGAKAFYNCISLDYIEIPDTVSVIEKSTFENCKALGQYDMAFYRGANAVQFGDGVTKIEDSAFKGCVGLQELILPKNVQELGSDVFSGCTALKNIKVYNKSGLDMQSACDIKLTYTSFPNLKGLVLQAYNGTVEDWVGSHTSYGVTFKTLYESYNVKIAAMEHGTVKANVKTAKMGDTVTLTVKPEDGYVLEYGSLYYTYVDNANNTKWEWIDSWDYSFVMPEYEVTIHAIFVEASTLEYGAELVLTDDGLFNKTNDDITYDEEKKVLSFSKPWQSVKIQVTGDNDKTPIYSQLKFSTSNSKAVTVDEKGNIRVIAPTTNTKITVALKDKEQPTKPLVFYVSTGKETYVEDIELKYTASRADVEYVVDDDDDDNDNEATQIGYDIITYPSSLLNTSARTIKIVTEGKDSNGDKLDINYSLTSNDTSIAKPAASKFTGEGKITIPKGALGETVVTVKAVDNSDEPAYRQFIVRIIDDTPRLANSTVKVDPQSTTGTLIDLVSVYSASPDVDDLTIEKKVVSKGNTSYVDVDDKFELYVADDGNIYLSALENADVKYTAGKNYTYKNTYYIHGTLNDSDTEFYIPIPNLTVCKKSIKPTVKLSGKINIFYNGLADQSLLGKVTVTQNQKDLVVERCELIGNTKANGVNTDDDEKFAANFNVNLQTDAKKQTITITRSATEKLESFSVGKSKNKPVLNGKIRIYYEGYTEPFDVKITVPTQTVVPSYTLSTTKISLNSYALGQKYDVSFINKKTKLVEDLRDGATKILLDVSDSGTTDGLVEIEKDEDGQSFTYDAENDTVHLSIKKPKKGKIVLILRQPEWEDQSAWNKKSAIKATISVSATTAFPTAKLGKSTLTVNAACPDVADYTTMKLNQADSQLAAGQVFTATGSKKSNAIEVVYENGQVITRITDPTTIKTGTYSYKCTPKFSFDESDDVDNAKAITVKVNVKNTKPSIKLKQTSFTLNANCRMVDDEHKFDYVTTTFSWVNLPSAYAGYEFSAEEPIITFKGKGTDYINADKLHFDVDAELKTATIYSESNRVAKGTYSISGLKLVKDGDEIPLGAVTITVNSINKTPTVTVSAKGTINPLDPASKIVYTPKLSNINGKIESVVLRELDIDNSPLAQGENHFTAVHDPSTGKTTVQVKNDLAEPLENRTYKIQLFYKLTNGEGETSVEDGGEEVYYRVAKDQKITPKQTMPKISVDVKSATFFAGNKERTKTITVTKKSTATADISGIKFSSKTSKTLQNAFHIESYDPATGEMVLKLKNSAFIKQNKEQTLTFEIVCNGQLQDTTGTTFTVKVKVIK